MAKMYGNGKPYGKAEFDKLLRNYSVRLHGSTQKLRLTLLLLLI